MEIRDVLHELGGYSVLLEMQSNPGLQALGKRLAEIADIVAKEAQAPRCWCLDDSGQSRCVQTEGTEEQLKRTRDWLQTPKVNPAPTPEARLVKELAVWWTLHSHKMDRGALDTLRRLARQAFRLDNNS